MKIIFLFGVLGFICTSFLPSEISYAYYGKVKSVKITSGSLFAYGEEESYPGNIVYYNKKGDLDSTVSVGESKNYLVSRNFYTKKHKLELVKSYSKKGKVDRIDSYSYDENDNLIAKKSLDSAGGVIFKTEFAYNSQNQLINENSFRLTSDGVSHLYLSYQYLYADNKISEQIFLLWGLDHTMYNYDHHGNVVMEMETSKTTENEKETNNTILKYYDYEYDEKGNWTSKKSYRLNSKRKGCSVFLTKREIEYY